MNWHEYAEQDPNPPRNDVVREMRHQQWLESERYILHASNDPRTDAFIEAARQGAKLNIVYMAGSDPFTRRTITAQSVFHIRGFSQSVYLSAYCHKRRANRTFRLDRIDIDWTDLMAAIGRATPRNVSGDALETALSLDIRIHLEKIDTLEDFQREVANRLDAPFFEVNRLESLRQIMQDTFESVRIVFSGYSTLHPALRQSLQSYLKQLNETAAQTDGGLSVVFDS